MFSPLFNAVLGMILLFLAVFLAMRLPLRLAVQGMMPSGPPRHFQGKISLLIGPYSVIRFELPKSVKKTPPKKSRFLKALQMMAFAFARHFLVQFWRGSGRLIIENLHLRMSLGTGDAARTAYAATLMYSTFYTGIGFLSRRITWSGKPEIQVRPVFSHAHVAGEFTCIFSVYLGDIIVAVWHTIRKGVRF